MTDGLRLGAFDLVHFIAKGGAADVWAGKHRATETPVAIKILRTAGANPGFARRFASEVRAIASLDHPRVTRVFDHGVVDATAGGAFAVGSPWLAMEYASGGTLLDCGALGWQVLDPVLHGLLAALAHAHARGVIHRDLKPPNVVLAGPLFGEPGAEAGSLGGTAKLADFGIARLLADAGEEVAIGTPAYMAPEQIERRWRDIGPWTDLYALGCMCHALIIGKPPFQGSNVAMVCARHLHAPPPPLPTPEGFPDGFAAWVGRMLSKRPEDRFPSAAEAMFALDELSAPRARFVSASRATAHTEASVTPLSGVGLGLHDLRVLPCVGRTGELRALWEVLLDAERARSQRVVLIRGPSGVGKSRVARWLCESASELCGVTVLRAEHNPRGGATDGVVGAMERHFRTVGLDPGEIPSRVLASMALQGLGAEEDGLAAALVDAEALPDRVHPLIHRHLAKLAHKRPVVFWVDDAHWGEDALRLCLSGLEEAVGPVVWVLTVQEEALATREAESELIRALGERADVTPLPLGPLGVGHRGELVQQILGLEPELAGQVASRTAGNALFAVQLVADWIGRGLLELGPHGFQLVPQADVALPADIDELWSGRVSALLSRDSSWRLPLEIAAVLGLEVSLLEWRDACARAAVDPGGLVDALLAERLMVEDPDARGVRVSFAHGMFRESVERVASQPAHRACAAMLEGRWGRGVASRRGWHLLHGDRPIDALEPLLRGATEALTAGSLGHAEHMLRARDQVLQDLQTPLPAEQADGWIVLAALLQRKSGHSEARRYLSAARELASEHGLVACETRAITASAELAWAQGNEAAAIELAREAVQIAGHAGPQESEGAQMALVRILARAGESEEVRQGISSGLRGAEAVRDEDAMARWAELADLVSAMDPALGLDTPLPAENAEDGLPAGTRVGRYVVLEFLGRGGSGVVLAAYDPKLGRRVALKMLDFSEDSKEVEARLQREARAIAQVQHANVLQVYDVGAIEGRPWVAMEYVEGADLAAWLAEKPRSVARILEVFVEAGRGLAAAHEVGLVHRDFKPSNVLIDNRGHARVLDFGLAVRPDERGGDIEVAQLYEETGGIPLLGSPLTRAGALVGTPAYMAPERLRGGTGDARGDQFSFGVALYEALHGRLPFAGEAVIDLVDAIETGPSRSVELNVPAWLARATSRALSADPADRFPNMHELCDALERRRAKRRRTLALRLGALALVLVTAFALFRPGELTISPTNDGAVVQADAIHLDGKPVDPQAKRHRLWPGKHEVRVEAAGYYDAEVLVTVRRGGVHTVPVPMTHEEASISVQVHPSSARISVDGVDHGSRLNRLSVPSGPHQIVVQHSGYYRDRFDWEAAEGDHLERTVALQEAIAWSQPGTGTPALGWWIGDLTGDGREELAHRSFGTFTVYDPWEEDTLFKLRLGPNLGSVFVADGDQDGISEVFALYGTSKRAWLESWSLQPEGAQLRWTVDLPPAERDTVRRWPPRADLDGNGTLDAVIGGFGGDSILALDLVSGEELWRRRLPEQVSVVSVAGDRVVVGTASATTAFTHSGIVSWTAPLASLPRSGGKFGTVGGFFSPASERDLDILWSAELDGSPGLELLLPGLRGEEEVLRAVDLADGLLLWEVPHTGHIPRRRQVADLNGDGLDDVLALSGETWRGIDGRTGTSLWELSEADTLLIWADRVLQRDDTALTVRDPETAEILATTQIPPVAGELGLVDLDANGTVELLVPTREALLVFGPDLTAIRTLDLDPSGNAVRIGTPADRNGDEYPEVLLDQAGPLVFSDSKVVWRIQGWDGFRAAPVAGDFDGDGAMELAVFGPLSDLDGLHLLDARTGQTLWAAAQSRVIRKPVLVGSGSDLQLVAAGHSGAAFYSLARREQLHSFKTLRNYGSPVVMDLSEDGKPEVLIATWPENAEVVAYDLASAEKVGSAPLSFGAWSEPIRAELGDEAVVIVPQMTGEISAFTDDLEPAWEVMLPGEHLVFPAAIADLDGDGSDELLTATSEGVFCVSLRERAVLWSVPGIASSIGTRVVVSQTPAGTGIFVGSPAIPGVVRLDTSGKEVWRSEVGSGNAVTVTDLDGDRRLEVLFGAHDGQVFALDGDTGEVLWRHMTTPGHQVEAPPLPVDIDGDGVSEIVVGGWDRSLRLLRNRPSR